jgi:hypothetical protein
MELSCFPDVSNTVPLLQNVIGEVWEAYKKKEEVVKYSGIVTRNVNVHQ